MTKKEFLIQLLEKIEPEWSLVSGFLIVLKDGNCTDNDINNTFTIIQDQIDSLHNEELRQHTLKTLQYIESLNQKEINEKAIEQEDINTLLDSINTL